MLNLCQKTKCGSHPAFFGSSPQPLSFIHLQRLYILIVAVYRQKFLQYTGEASRAYLSDQCRAGSIAPARYEYTKYHQKQVPFLYAPAVALCASGQWGGG